MNLAHYVEIAGRVRRPTQAFIDGAPCDAADRAVFETTNPATGEVLGTLPQCGAADVDRAVRAARRAFDSGVWSRAAPEHRKLVLLKLAGLVREHAEELAVLESLDSGKTVTDCLNEVGHEVPTFFQWYAELVDKSFGKVVPTAETALALIVREPIGVVGLVVPWNFPLLMAAWKLAPALAAGCSAVLKPAEQTPLSAIRLAELAAEAGLPPGVLNVLTGDGETTGRAVGLHPDVDAVSFTGSTEVGALFLHYAADSNMKTVGLEMGGKSPLIVLDDAVLDDAAVSSIVMAACWNGGQNCSANMRQIVHRSRREEFLAKVGARMGALVTGNPLDPATEIGAMITAEHRKKVLGYVEAGSREGARLVLGGHARADLPGYFVEPTLFDGVTPDMAIAREEIFGPVLGVMECGSPEEALRLAADTPFGLHATIFTSDLNRAVSLARRLPCGTVAVNKFTEGDVKTPFGGYRRSGSLARDNGTEAMEQYMQTKTIWFEIAPSV